MEALLYVVDLPIAENQRMCQFEAAKHMTSGRCAAPSGLANPEDLLSKHLTVSYVS